VDFLWNFAKGKWGPEIKQMSYDRSWWAYALPFHIPKDNFKVVHTVSQEVLGEVVLQLPTVVTCSS
jgi:hypothetical protein